MNEAMPMKRYRLVFSGSGGQGIITAAIILAETAVIKENLNAVQSQSYGAAARGGATRSDVIISKEVIDFPRVIQPNCLVCLTQTAYNKFQNIIRPGGLLITDPHWVETSRKVDARQLELPLYETVMEKIGNPIVLNICMLGAVVALIGLVRPDSIIATIKDRIPDQFLEMNENALKIGVEIGKNV